MEIIKLKVQNVIRILLIFSIFCSSFNLYSQKKIIGKYSSLKLYQEHYNYFVFNENGIFEYHYGASLGEEEFGKGNYVIKNDSLVLNYNLTELKHESYFKSKKYFNSKDSIQVNLRVYNFNKEPLNNVMMYSFPTYKTTLSDKKGTAFLKFKKQPYKNKIKLHVEGIFLAKQVIYLDGDTNYDIDVFMSKSMVQYGHPEAIKDQTIKYKILDYKDNFIKLKNNNDILKLIKITK